MADPQLELFADNQRPDAAAAGLRSGPRAVPPAAPAAWPSSGITGPGSWGSRDGYSWEKVEVLKVGGKGGFVMGYLVDSPESAREAMRAGVLSVTPRR